jgi:UDP-N-acetylglucosamine 2-epimerase (non-hydrolysing)
MRLSTVAAPPLALAKATEVTNVSRNVVCVAGARPNFVKAKPVVDAVEARGVRVVLVHTGQHYDPEMSDVFFADLDLRRPDLFLGVGSGSHAHQTARVMTAFEDALPALAAGLVLVFGDVNSTLAAALVAAKSGALVGHVEAGLRSRDWSMPEEVNRVVVDRISDLLLAPSPDALDNLRAEGCCEHRLHLVGNVMADTLLANLSRARERRDAVLGRLGLKPREYGIVTLHRPENVDVPGTLARLLNRLERLGSRLPLVLPAHPRTARNVVPRPFANLRLLEPLGYLDFVALEMSARLAITDSGGVQEETTLLGIPCLTLRDTTDRPITVTHGTNTVIGRNGARLEMAFLRALDGVERRRPSLWDGRAAERIADVVIDSLAAETFVRPSASPAADIGDDVHHPTTEVRRSPSGSSKWNREAGREAE